MPPAEEAHARRFSTILPAIATPITDFPIMEVSMSQPDQYIISPPPADVLHAVSISALNHLQAIRSTASASRHWLPLGDLGVP